MIKKSILLLLIVDLAVLILLFFRGGTGGNFHSAGKKVQIDLRRGSFAVYEFLPEQGTPAALILFGSGDGGWGSWEDSVASALKQGGYEVIGIDSAAYAKTDYDLGTLQADSNTIARHFLRPFAPVNLPVIVGGWSMGAGQAIAAAGGAHPPPHLAGLLLASPLSRGRYGLRLADQLNVLPTGPGTFAVGDFSGHLKDIRIVQWHASGDNIDSRAWLQELPTEHREYDLYQAGHDYDGADEDFRRRFVASVGWILQPGLSESATRHR